MPIYRTDEQLEELGLQVLCRLGLEHRIRPDPMTVIVKLKHLVPGFGYRRVPDEKMRHAEAEWDSDACEIAMRESIFVGMQRGDPHSCFVVYHELSHYCLGHKGTRNRIAEAQLRRMSAPGLRHEESEASRLAVILMAPEHLVPENSSTDDLATMFGLSLTAAALRKEEIDRIRRRRRGELRRLPESIKEMLRNARDRGFPIQTQLDD